jgi:hypothetical protein
LSLGRPKKRYILGSIPNQKLGKLLWFYCLKGFVFSVYFVRENLELTSSFQEGLLPLSEWDWGRALNQQTGDMAPLLVKSHKFRACLKKQTDKNTHLPYFMGAS